MTARSILETVESYRKARMSFVQTVGEIALRPNNIELLLSVSALELLKPLLEDVCPQIQQCAAITLGRLAHHNAHVGKLVIEESVLSILFRDLKTRTKYYRKAAMFALRAICKHNAETTEAVITSAGTLDALIMCLMDLDTSVRESAAWATGYIARHGSKLARMVVDMGAVPHLVLCLQEHELAVRRVAVSALADIAKHEPYFAQVIIDSNGVGYLARALNDRDDPLKRQAIHALASISRHGYQFAETVVQAEIFPDILLCLGHKCPTIRRNTAMLVRDVVKHTLELAQLVVNSGGVGAIIEMLKVASFHKDIGSDVDARVPCVAALGYIAGSDSKLACCVVKCGGISTVQEIMNNAYPTSDLASVCAWCLGQIGKFCPGYVADSGILPKLLELAATPGASEELKIRCNTALKQCVQGCTKFAVLEPLLMETQPDILDCVLAQLAKIFPRDPRARRLFVVSGGLKKIQEIRADPGTSIMESITMINQFFPEEIVRYYTPGYTDTLLDQVELFSPTLELDRDITGDTPPGPSPCASRAGCLSVIKCREAAAAGLWAERINAQKATISRAVPKE
ncbi:karyopherin alpha3 [Carabus blaptoides fortunei]